MAASHLRAALGETWKGLALPALEHLAPADLDVLETAMAGGLNAPLTSSCGRLFDAAAAILGFRGPHRYSAQAPMELEALAGRSTDSVPGYPSGAPSAKGDLLVLEPGELVRALVDDVLAGRDRGACALGFHKGLADLFARGAAAACSREGLSDVFLTGGCVQNAVFARELAGRLRASGLIVHQHREVPPNDGGIAFGQVAWTLAAGAGAAGP